MTEVINGFFKYLIPALAVLYTLLEIPAFLPGSLRRANRLLRGQTFFMCLLLFSCYFLIFVNGNDWRMLAFCAVQLICYPVYIHLFQKLYRDCSRLILSNMVTLFSIGIMFLSRLDMEKAVKQFVIGIAGMLLILFIPAIIKRFIVLSHWAWVYAVFGIAVLAVVWRLGSTTYGAQLTFSIGPFRLQPSEFVKITFVLFTASMFSKGQSFPRTILTTVIAAVHVLILVASTDLGSGFVYFISFIFMLFVATQKPGYLLAGIGAGAVAAVGAYRLFDHVRVRVQVWLDPLADYENKGYQLSQSLFALGSGGLFGLGLCRGYPSMIPLARNDFIFSAMCEELGLVFGCMLILIYLCFVTKLFLISARLKNTFYQITGVGFAAMLGVQVFLHIGGVTGMIPSTGITLPLISYGGSSVLSTLIITGIIQGLNLTAVQENEQEVSR